MKKAGNERRRRRGESMQQKVLDSDLNCDAIDCEVFKVKYGGDEILIKDAEYEGAALKAACILLEQGQLKRFSEQHHKEVTVIGKQKTMVYDVWREFHPECHKDVSEIQTKCTTVNKSWFDHNAGLSDTMAYNTDMQHNVSDVDAAASQFPSVSLSSESNVRVIEEALQELPKPGTKADQLIPLMKTVFGYTFYQLKQEEAINCYLKKNNTFVVMPTGGGKSMTFILPALALPGIAIIISPLRSLIEDQINRCAERGVNVACIVGEMRDNERQKVFAGLRQSHCLFKLLYTTPETITADEQLQDILLSLYCSGSIQQFIIDEAHCVSLWGLDFRPAYNQLKMLHIQYPDIPILMLTATATDEVIGKVNVLQLIDVTIIKSDFNRPNLSYLVHEKSKMTLEEIIAIVKPLPCSLVYCSTRFDCEELSAKLAAKGVICKAYHAAMSKQLRSSVQIEWMSGSLQVLCCTSAFGMGVDKTNVRAVLHYSLPASMEDYYQQTGRGGRDGLPCQCVMYFNANEQVHHVHQMFSKFGCYTNTKALMGALTNFQMLMDYCLNKHRCRTEMLLSYFGQAIENNCGTCDICTTSTVVNNLDVTKTAIAIGSCVQKIKNDFNGKKLTVKQMATIIKGKKTAEIVKKKYNELPGYGCFMETSEQGELLLRRLVIADILREVPHESKQTNALYLDLGSNFMTVLNNETTVTFFKIVKKQ